LKYLSLDGGVNAETFVKAAEAGANVFIAGSSIFWEIALSPMDAMVP